VLGAALLTGAALPATGLWAGIASAAPRCLTSPATQITTCTFNYTGTSTDWAVPSGVTSLTVVADGGSGAASSNSSAGAGGAGGEYQATLTGIPAGSTLSVFPGGAATVGHGGTDAGSGGGTGSTDMQSNTAGGGGGASTVAISPYSFAHLLVVAGGGGGGAAERGTDEPTPPSGGYGGSSSTTSGADGSGINVGLGGTPTAGGTGGGASGCATAATDGGQLAGGSGNAGNCSAAGGGGGSGYYGGGGAAATGGGGGGSAYPAAAVTIGGILVTPAADADMNTGNGVITISYHATTATATTLTSSKNPSTFGQSVTFTATVTPTDGGGTVGFKDGSADIAGCTAQKLKLVSASYRTTCTTTSLGVGTDTITARYSGDTAYAGSTSRPLTQTVNRAPTSLTPSITFSNLEETFTVSATLDSLGTPIPGQPLTFTVGLTKLCTATTDRHGTASCALTPSQSLLVWRTMGQFTVSFAGTPGYYPSTATNGRGL
jgi:hypothetical protein